MQERRVQLVQPEEWASLVLIKYKRLRFYQLMLKLRFLQ